MGLSYRYTFGVDALVEAASCFRERGFAVVTGLVAADIVDSLRRAGVSRLYVSNDIDGTDPRWAAATGTAEPNGLRTSDVEVILGTVTAAIECVGADLVEVAPTLKWHVPGEPRRTLQTAARYALLQIDALLGGGSDLAAALPFPAPAEPGAVAATPAWV